MSNLQLVFTQDASKILMTDSRRLAEGFGARHDSVIRKIEGILSDTEENFRSHNFVEAETNVIQSNNGAVHRVKTYQMTRDGFMHIALTFSGKKGCEFRVKVIQAFNEMEAKLKSAGIPSSSIPPLLEQAKMLLAGWEKEQTLRIAAESERDLYQDSLVKLDDYVKNKPVTAVGEHGIPSHAIIKEYPEVVGMMYDDFKQNLYWSKKYSAYPEHSKVSVWLLCFGKIPALKRKLPRSKSYINLFSRADIEGFLARRQQSDEVQA
jgi:Rha family phage regulatory protein